MKGKAFGNGIVPSVFSHLFDLEIGVLILGFEIRMLLLERISFLTQLKFDQNENGLRIISSWSPVIDVAYIKTTLRLVRFLC